MTAKPIVIGADPWGEPLKQAIADHLASKNIEVVDLNTDAAASSDYYDVACRASETIQQNSADTGILFCGTGMGMAIVANKHKGIIASVVESPWGAKMARAVNDANVLTMGAMKFSPDDAIEAVDIFLTTQLGDGLEEYTDFLNNAVRKVNEIEAKNLK